MKPFTVSLVSIVFLSLLQSPAWGEEKSTVTFVNQPDSEEYEAAPPAAISTRQKHSDMQAKIKDYEDKLFAANQALSEAEKSGWHTAGKFFLTSRNLAAIGAVLGLGFGFSPLMKGQGTLPEGLIVSGIASALGAVAAEGGYLISDSDFRNAKEKVANIQAHLDSLRADLDSMK